MTAGPDGDGADEDGDSGHDDAQDGDAHDVVDSVDADDASDPSETTDWPVALRGITESVVTTRGPNDRWNIAALGVRAGKVDTDAEDDVDDSSKTDIGANSGTDIGANSGADVGEDTSAVVADDAGADDGASPGNAVTARTYGRTRTWRNFRERGTGYVQFTRDPVDFVEAALAVREADEPLIESADAWCRVAVTELGVSDERGTTITTWRLEPVESAVERETVATTNRGFNAVVEATVAASRLDVDSFDESVLLDRLAYFADVAETCGGAREREAFARIESLTDAER